MFSVGETLTDLFDERFGGVLNTDFFLRSIALDGKFCLFPCHVNGLVNKKRNFLNGDLMLWRFADLDRNFLVLGLYLNRSLVEKRFVHLYRYFLLEGFVHLDGCRLLLCCLHLYRYLSVVVGVLDAHLVLLLGCLFYAHISHTVIYCVYRDILLVDRRRTYTHIFYVHLLTYTHISYWLMGVHLDWHVLCPLE